MLKRIEKIPAGTFLVPMLLSALIYTLAPNLFQIGGLTEHIFGGSGTTAIIGAVCFCSGVGIDLKNIGYAAKRQGVLLLAKLAISIALSLLYMLLFGQAGILGINAMAFTIMIATINPAIYISVMKQYGNDQDVAVYGLTSLFAIPAVPMLVYGIAGGGGMDWMPVWSTLLPMLVGMVLGNLDSDIKSFFMPAVSPLLSLMGWNLGYGLNLVEAFKSGLSGALLTLIFILVSFVYIFIDKQVLKNDGVVGAGLISVSGLSVSTAVILGEIYPELMEYVTSAASQVLMGVVITAVLGPMIVGKVYHSAHKN